MDSKLTNNSSRFTVSVIIPTLNEESCLGHTLKPIGAGVEIIVADAKSSDATLKIAGRFTEKIILSEKGRGAQMDRGAREAQGDILVFLHADAILPEDWQERIAAALKDDRIIAGGFRLKIDSDRKSFKLIEKTANLRSKYLGLIYGDQAIFLKREAFLSAGGFKGLPLMEDVDLMRRLRKTGKIALLDAYVSVSPRHWERNGILKTTLRNWLFLCFYYLGVSPESLYKRYYA